MPQLRNNFFIDIYGYILSGIFIILSMLSVSIFLICSISNNDIINSFGYIAGVTTLIIFGFILGIVLLLIGILSKR